MRRSGTQRPTDTASRAHARANIATTP